MKLKNRLLLVSGGVIIFLVVTPVLVLFARGFKFDWQKHQLVKTGTIVAQTDPDKAQVILNGQLNGNITPSTIRFLLPGDYDIRIEKNGYYSWTKRLQVKSQFVTWANATREFLILFLSEPKNSGTIDIQNFYLPKDRKQVVLARADGVSYLDINTKLIEPLGSNDLTLHPFDFSSILAWVDAKRSFDLITSKKKFDLDDRLLPQIKSVETNGNYVILFAGNSLYEVNGKLNLLETEISNFSLAGDELWYIKSNALSRLNLQTMAKSVVASDVPAAGESKIIRGNGHVFLLLDGILYALNDKLEKIGDPVKSVYWDQELGKLLYANDFEVFLFSPLENSSELIFRSTTKISSPVPNATTGYVFYQNENKIKAIELDGRDHRNVYTLTEALDDFLVSRDGKLLYTFSKTQIKTYEIR